MCSSDLLSVDDAQINIRMMNWLALDDQVGEILISHLGKQV